MMKKTTFLCATVAVLLLTLASCKHEERYLVRYSQTDSTGALEGDVLESFVWEDGVLKQSSTFNPQAKERAGFDDYSAVFNYSVDYAYENGLMQCLTGNKFHSVFTYDEGKVVQIDQLSNDGVLAYRAKFTYVDEETIEAEYLSMSKEAIQWMECQLYPRRDSTGAQVLPEMPEDTTLKLNSKAIYHWQGGNLVSIKTEFIGLFTTESELEYDNKINPFYHTYCDIDRQDVFPISIVFGQNNIWSKNNVTRVTVKSSMMGATTTDEPLVLEFSYKYEGDYPVLQKDEKASHYYRYDYDK